jgi:uncharacterized phage protein gp47/JayE
MAGLSSSGFEKKTAEEILNDTITKARAAFGDTFAENDDTPEYIDLALKADSLAEVWEAAEAVYYSGFRDTAEGVNLDFVCANIGVQRITARASIVRGVTLTNDTLSPAIIPAGSLARQSSTLRDWATLTEVTIPAGGTITVDMQCTEVGAFTAPIASIDTIVNPVLGWDDVNNSAAVLTEDLGRTEESDSDLRIRAASSLIQSTGGVVSAIANRVL